jgi:competence/damage-inducible protein CinA-like protein
MPVALLTTGNELLRGEVANANALWLAEQLTDLNFTVDHIEVVGDEHAALVAAIGRLASEPRVLICTGGLGPTEDDRTSAAAAEVFGVALSLDEDALGTIRRFVETRGGELHEGHRKQARLPEGASLLHNSNGTAPGFMLEKKVGEGVVQAYFLPGVPPEMRAMFEQHVEPRIRAVASNDSFHILLHTVGAGESLIADKLAGVSDAFDVSLGYRAKSSEVDIRVVAHGADVAEAREKTQAAADEIRSRLGEYVYGEGSQSMPKLVGKAVRRRGWRLAVAESCTGGLIAQQLTAHPASDFFVGGAVVYANTAKTEILGVSEDTLRGHGAVSAEVAAQMAEGARRNFDCDVAISVTGIAGPTGATPDKPIGLCHYAVAHPGGTEVAQSIFTGNRSVVQKKAAHAALDLLRRTLNGSH